MKDVPRKRGTTNCKFKLKVIFSTRSESEALKAIQTQNVLNECDWQGHIWEGKVTQYIKIFCSTFDRCM